MTADMLDMHIPAPNGSPACNGVAEAEVPETTPIVDVLIPVFNAAAHLAEAIASVQRQTIANIRIIVVDDGSMDDSLRMLRQFAAGDERILVIVKNHSGIVDALNTGLSICKAPFLARFDSDDVCFPDRLERQLAYLRDHPDCVAVGGNAMHLDASGKRTGRGTRFGGDVEHDAAAFPAREPYIEHPLLMVRREAVVAVGGYRHVFNAEDSDLYWRLLSIGRLHNLQDLLGERRHHPASVTNRSVAHGRASAIFSQLAALDHLRRESGRRPLDFGAEKTRQVRASDGLADMISIASRALDEDEAAHFELAVASKLMALASFQLYSLEKADFLYIRDVLRRRLRSVPARGRRQVRLAQAQLLFRQLRDGAYRNASACLSAALPMLILRTAARRLVRAVGRNLRREAV